MDEPEKKIDLGWKEQVAKEKEQAAEGQAVEREQSAGPAEEPVGPDEELPPPPEASFALFITGLAMQASVCLGDVPDPATGQPNENLPYAKYLIDTLGILGEKTEGNLSSDESEMLKSILSELRMRYVSKADTT